MRGLNREGQLVAPRNFETALVRRERCRRDINNVLDQLRNPERAARYPNPAYYERWKTAADRALRALLSEEQQLTAWIESRHVHHLTQARDLLESLQDELEDFDEEETRTVAGLNRHLSLAK